MLRCYLRSAAGYPGQPLGVSGLLQPDGPHPGLVLPELASPGVPVRGREDAPSAHEESLLHGEVAKVTNQNISTAPVVRNVQLAALTVCVLSALHCGLFDEQASWFLTFSDGTSCGYVGRIRISNCIRAPLSPPNSTELERSAEISAESAESRLVILCSHHP